LTAFTSAEFEPSSTIRISCASKCDLCILCAERNHCVELRKDHCVDIYLLLESFGSAIRDLLMAGTRSNLIGVSLSLTLAAAAQGCTGTIGDAQAPTGLAPNPMGSVSGSRTAPASSSGSGGGTSVGGASGSGGTAGRSGASGLGGARGGTGGVAGGAGAATGTSTTTVWKPAPGLSWQWQLTGTIDTSVDAAMFDVDLFDVPALTVAALHALGRKVICYTSAGSFEDWRPDAAQFPAAVKGKALAGWPGEAWLDVRQIALLAPIFNARMDLCRSKGFDGIELDNVDGYTNDTGFPLSAADQLQYNRALADAAHARGLSVALKNDLAQVKDLVSTFDWALNEECFQFNECNLLAPFIQAGKAVFNVEYSLPASTVCPQAKALGFSTLIKNLNLDAQRQACP
jgi:hypothetical protein